MQVQKWLCNVLKYTTPQNKRGMLKNDNPGYMQNHYDVYKVWDFIWMVDNRTEINRD